MRLQEVTHPVDRPGLQFRRVLPGIDRDVGVRRQRRDVDGGLVRVRRRCRPAAPASASGSCVTKSRDTLCTKSARDLGKGCVRYFSMVSVDTSGRRSRSSLPQVRPELYITFGFSGRWPIGWLSIPATTRSGARSISLAQTSRRCSCRRRRTGGCRGGPSVPTGRRRRHPMDCRPESDRWIRRRWRCAGPS